MSAILLEREIVHYEVLGRGRPVIFLHGWVGSWRYWIPVMQSASMSFRAYALDLWGFGDTSKNPQHYSLVEQVRLLETFLDQMGILRFALVGHGLGAILGMLFAYKNPAMVDRLMAVSCPLEESSIAHRLRTDSPVSLADWLLGKLPALEPARVDTPKADPQAIQSSLASLSTVRLREIYCSLQTPYLFVHGQADPAIQAPRMEQLAELPQQAHALTFEQSGHFPMLDESSKFNRLLGDFLGLASGVSPRDLQLKEEWKRRVR